MPFSSTRVIPTGWSRHHQPVARGGMTAKCQIEDPTREIPGVFDDTDGSKSAPTPFVTHTGPCRVQEIDSAKSAFQAGQDVTERRYLVSVDASAEARQGWVVRITDCPNDSQLGTAILHVSDVQYGSERFERDLICTFNEG